MESTITEVILENKKDRSLGRAIGYVTTFFSILLLFIGWQFMGWSGSLGSYQLIEIITVIASFIAGVVVISLYYSTRHNQFLVMVGVGMIGVGVIDTLIPLITSEVSHWTWSASWIYLSIVLMAMVGLKAVANYLNREQIVTSKIFVLGSLLLALFVLYFSWATPVETSFLLGPVILRPVEIIAGLLFLVSAILLIGQKTWAYYVFDNFVMYLLLFSTLSNLMVLPFSMEIYDSAFTVAQILKLLSSVAILAGGLGSIHFLFHHSELWRVKLMDLNESLLRFKQDSDITMEKMTTKQADIEGQLSDLEGIKKATINILEDLHDEKVKLGESKAKDEAVLNSIGDGLVVTDTEMNVLLINKQTEKMIGWNFEEMNGKKWLDFVMPIDEKSKKTVESDKLPIHVALKIGKRSQQNNFLYLCKDESRLPVSITCSPIISDGQVVGAVIVFRDITHEKEVDRSKTEFVSLASHQLRTPLSAINWYAEMLIAGDAGEVSEEQKSYVEEIYHSNQRMVELVDSLLNVSRIDLGTIAVEPVPTNIVSVCKSVVEELRPQITMKKIELKEDYDSSLPEIDTDPKLMRIIFQNLLSNAVKYTPEEGHVSVAVKLENKAFMIVVADTGYGIPKKQHGKIFTKLFRADNAMEKETDGTGLGLYIVKSITEEAGGQISFESEENKGTTFFVEMPLDGMKKTIGSKGLS